MWSWCAWAGKPSSLEQGFPPLSPSVTQTGVLWPGFGATGSLLLVFLHWRQDNVSGPKASLKQGSCCLGSTPKFSLQFPRQGLVPVWAPAQAHRFAVELGTDLQSASWWMLRLLAAGWVRSDSPIRKPLSNIYSWALRVQTAFWGLSQVWRGGGNSGWVAQDSGRSKDIQDKGGSHSGLGVQRPGFSSSLSSNKLRDSRQIISSL